MNIGLSTSYFHDINSADICSLLQEEIYRIEYSMPQARFSAKPAELAADLQALKECCDGTAITLVSYHIPYGWDWDLSIEDKTQRQRNVQKIACLIETVVETWAPSTCFVLHPSFEPLSEDEDIRQRLIENFASSIESLKDSLALLEDHGLRIAIENLPRTCLGRNHQEMTKLLNTDSRLRLCFDTNHLLGEPIHDFLVALSEQIIHLHVSDYDFVNERHWLPGTGKIDWSSLMAHLEKIAFNGTFLYEIGPHSGGPENRPVTLQTITDNYAELLTLN